MREQAKRTAGLLAVGALCAASAQTHKVEKPQAVVRAVGVYEWTGELNKPKASRLVPVTVFIDGELHDGGIYEPQPIPFALEPGVEYEVQRAGAPQGTLVLETARHRTSDENGEGDAWFGYGRYTTEAAAKAAAPLRVSRVNPVIVSSKDPDAKDTGTGTTTGAGGTRSGGGRPGMGGRRGDTGSAGSQPSSTDDGRTAGAGNDQETNASDDVDRPTLKRRTPAEDKKARKQADQPRVSAAGAGPGDDPDRPVLHRGGSSDLGEATGVPQLMGVPADLKQAAAVSDAATRPEHEFTRPWADDAERVTVLAKMQALARKQLAAYHGSSSTEQMSAAAASADSDPGRPELRRGAPSGAAAAKVGTARGNKAAAAARAGSGKSAAAGTALVDEQLKGFTLSYGAQPVFVYTAQTAGDEKVARYVTVVTEQEIAGELRPVLESVTDVGHLDRTPWMRFVDAVDAEASNRGSLLFELRYAGTRSFALYRVLGASATQLAATGSTP